MSGEISIAVAAAAGVDTKRQSHRDRMNIIGNITGEIIRHLITTFNSGCL